MEADISVFVSIRRVDPRGVECWSSREFAEALGYTDRRNFEAVLEKAKLACLNSGQPVEDHFVDINEMITIGKGGQRAVKTTLLSRYACYLAIQNADPGKPRVALGQTYFAVQTRRQELSDEANEAERRLRLREELRTHNTQLADAARGAGVVEPRDYAIFQNHGYQGLYGGLKAQDIHRRKQLQPSEQILDHMGSAELAANPVSGDAGRRKAPSRGYRRQGQRQPHPPRGRGQSPTDHPRTRRHHARRPADCREHQATRSPPQKGTRVGLKGPPQAKRGPHDPVIACCSNRPATNNRGAPRCSD